MRTVAVLFTRDLRVADNPALSAACNDAERVALLYVVDPEQPAPPGRARFLAQSLADLRESLRALGGELTIRRGDPVAQTLRFCQETSATAVSVTDDYGPYAARLRRRLEEGCQAVRIDCRIFPGVTVVDPGRLRPTSGGEFYKIFTPYWKAWSSQPWRRRVDVPEHVPAAGAAPRGEEPVDAVGMTRGAPPGAAVGGESAAWRRWEQWLQRRDDYSSKRDQLAEDATSRLSPYLHFGCISPLVVAGDEETPEGVVRQLSWRDFFHQVLAAFPDLATTAFRPGGDDAWNDDPLALQAWQSGNTGVPIVDAGMRQLLSEGWMHNRARMVAASYLTKTLGVDWRLGAEWFDRWLLDADVANNYGNWQQTAGTGFDPKPYRRFNPRRQAERFDPNGDYVRRWLGL